MFHVEHYAVFQVVTVIHMEHHDNSDQRSTRNSAREKFIFTSPVFHVEHSLDCTKLGRCVHTPPRSILISQH